MAKPTVGRLIANRYALRSPLGRGGMGVVWRAEDTLLAREVAIKEVQLPPALNEADGASMRARVMREARAAARLNHPGAVTLFDVVQEEGNTFIVMELVEAPTLAQVIHDRGPLPPDQVAAIGLEILDALRAAHRVGIVHRDVKPGNVMVAPGEAGAKLADFGIASLAGDPQLTSTGLVLGSPAYMAPEQASGKASGPPSDLWALGATMYYAVEGEAPFDREGSIPTLTAVVNDPPRPPRRAGPLAPVIAALLSKSPADRPSASHLQRELERVVAAGAGGTAGHPAVAVPDEHEHETTARLPAVAPPVPVPPAGAPAAEAEAAAAVEDAAPVEDAPPVGESPRMEAAGAAAEAAPPPAPVAPPGPDVEAAPARDLRPPARPPVLPSVTPRPRSRRLPALAAVALLAVAAVLAAVLWGAFPSGGERKAGAPSPTTTRAGRATTSTGPAPTRAPATTGKTTKTTTSAPTTAGQPTQVVPSGWTISKHPDRGFSVAIPPGWKTSEGGGSNPQVTFRAPDGDRNFFVQSTSPANDLEQAGKTWEAHIRQQYGNHGLNVLSSGFQTFQNKKAYVFEYTYQDKGTTIHERDVNVALGRWGYSMVFHAPDSDWDGAKQVWSGVEQSFQALG